MTLMPQWIVQLPIDNNPVSCKTRDITEGNFVLFAAFSGGVHFVNKCGYTLLYYSPYDDALYYNRRFKEVYERNYVFVDEVVRRYREKYDIGAPRRALMNLLRLAVTLYKNEERRPTELFNITTLDEEVIRLFDKLNVYGAGGIDLSILPAPPDEHYDDNY